MSPTLQFSLEQLESRRLLTVSAHLVFGSLHVAGNAFLANDIAVGNSADGLTVDVNIHWTTLAGVAKSFSKSFDISRVLNLDIHGGVKADTVTIDQSHSLFAKKTIVDTFLGNDTITAGDEDDRIAGGAGDDKIDAGNGDNIVRGLLGNDTIITGSGNDKINGGPGDDSIDSGSGDDTIVGGAGNDSISAGDGNDKVFGGPGIDTILGNPGNDTLWGGAGDDSIVGGPGNDTLGGVIGQNHLIGGTGHDVFVVRSLTLNPDNDFSASEDTVIKVLAEAPSPII
jgi:Ca2+-binding RTX toxin-like protein